MSRTLRLSSDVNLACEDGGCVLLDLRRGAYYALNDAGAAIVARAQAGAAGEEICAAIAERYGVLPEIVKPDVDRFIEQLEQLGILKPV